MVGWMIMMSTKLCLFFAEELVFNDRSCLCEGTHSLLCVILYYISLYREITGRKGEQWA